MNLWRRVIARTAIATLAIGAAWVTGALPARAQSALEYQVKATFLYRFASFVTWPASAFTEPESPIALCIIGQDPFGAVLDNVVRGQVIGGRAIVVRRLGAYAGAGCHILYVGGGDQAVEETLRAARGATVLTVTDSASGGVRGMIHFVVVDDHVRFHIDDARAAESGLAISSRLLDLGVSVRRRAG